MIMTMFTFLELIQILTLSIVIGFSIIGIVSIVGLGLRAIINIIKLSCV